MQQTLIISFGDEKALISFLEVFSYGDEQQIILNLKNNLEQ